MGHGKMDVRIYKSVGSKNMFLSHDQRIFYCGCSNYWVGGWVTKNPNIVRIFKSVGINGRSLNPFFDPHKASFLGYHVAQKEKWEKGGGFGTYRTLALWIGKDEFSYMPSNDLSAQDLVDDSDQ